MTNRIEDYITLPVVNQMIAEGRLSKKDAVKYITDCAAAKHFLEMYDSSDDVVVDSTEDVTDAPTDVPTNAPVNVPVTKSTPVEPEVISDNAEDDGIATGTEEDPE